MNYGAPSFSSGLGQNTARTSYGPGSATTRTTGMSMPGGNDQLLEFFKQLARKRLQGGGAPPQSPIGAQLGGGGLRPDLHQVQQQERPGKNPLLGGAQSDDPGLIGSYRTVGGQTFLEANPHGDTFMGYGRGQAVMPQNAGFAGTGGPMSTAAEDLAAGSPQGPAIDDQSWRLAQFRSQFPTGVSG